jgi:hypothetical protein
MIPRTTREERRYQIQVERLRHLTDDQVHDVGVELFNRLEQFSPTVRQIVNDELRRRKMQTVPSFTGDEVDYG